MSDTSATTMEEAEGLSAAQEQRIAELVQKTLGALRGGTPSAQVQALAQAEQDAPPANGFETFGQFALAVHKAAAQGGRVDPRLITKAPGTWAGEAVGDSGGFLVPAQWSDHIWNIVVGAESLLARTNQIPTSRNALSLPVNAAQPWGTSGVQAYWVDEAGSITQSAPKFEYRNLRLHKLAALVPASDELLEDAPALEAFIVREAGRAIRHKADDAILNGDGVGKPLGVMQSAALVTVSKEGSQSADTVVAGNIAKMYARMPAASLGRAVWLMNQDVLPQLLTMTLGNQPVYLPPHGIGDAPFGTLLGRPVLLSPHCQTVGAKGDILFVDLGQYLSLTKTGGIKAASSMHLWFDHEVTAFRFTFRLAGQPWLNAVVTPAHGSSALSPFVTLESR